MLGRQLLAWTAAQVRKLYPGCFALVMATGIIANALFAEGPRALSDALFLVGVVVYFWLVALTAARAICFAGELRTDLLNRSLVFSFFTIVAATAVLGEALGLRGFASPTLYFWLFALTVWVVLVYFSFAVLTFSTPAHPLPIVEDGWLLAIVGTEALSGLGTAVAPAAGAFGSSVSVLSHLLWGIGLQLYAIYVVLFVYRLLFFALKPADITPALWVVMGAAAISTDAGSALLLAGGGGVRFLHAMSPFIAAVTAMTWAWASLWIPFLLMLFIWKHAVRREPLRYTPLLWSGVFPVGMYAMATLRFSQAAHFVALRDLSRVVVWIALAAWTATIVALIVASWRDFGAFRRAASAPVRR